MITKILTITITILFCWVIFPYKWITKAVFIHRMSKAKKQANKRAQQTNETVYVIQLGRKFYVGIRSELKKLDRYAAKYLKLTKKESKLWDYRNCIIYKTK